MDFKRYFSPKKALLRFLILLFSFGILIFSWLDSYKNNFDKKILFLFDNSLSMTTQDIRDSESQNLLSRFSVSTNLVKNFLPKIELNSEFAVATFSRDFALELPFSSDLTLTQNIISSISPISYWWWSDIFQALETFSEIYKNSSNINLIIFSDIEFFEEKKLPKFPPNTNIFIFWIGTTSGWNMILQYDSSGKPIYKQFQGENAISKISISAIQNFSKNLNSPYCIISTTSDLSKCENEILNFILNNSNKKSNFLEIFAYFGILFAIFLTIFPYYENKK